MVLRSWISLSTLFLAALAFPALSADWRDDLSKTPGKHPLPRPLIAQYDFGWSGIKAAEATVKFSNSGKVAKLDVAAKTIGAARTLWKLDAIGTATANATTLRPIQVSETESYSRKSIKTDVDFTSAGPRRVRDVTPPDPDPGKPKTFKLPMAHDLHSALLFIRSQRLAKGDVIRLCVFPNTSPYYAEVRVGSPEKVKVAGKEWSAIPCDLKLQEVEKDYTLKPHSKFKKATAWISNDSDRLLLRIEAEIYVGAVKAELREVQFN